MRFHLLLVTILMCGFLANGQTANEEMNDEPQIINLKDVENPPLARGCKSKWDRDKKQKYVSMFISQHINRKFDLSLAAKEGIFEMVHIKTRFVIDEEGKISAISATGGTELLNKHAEEVVATIPDFKAAVQDGSPVAVLCEVPIIFQVTKRN